MGVPSSAARLFAGALSAPLLLLAACGGGDSSIADPPVAPASSSPTQAPHRESPEHFIRRWAEAEKRMENTGKTRAYLAMSRRCEACRGLAHDIERYYAAGGFVHWKGWTILSISKTGSRGGNVIYEVRVNSQPTRYKTSSGAPIQRLKGGRATHQLTIARVHGSWQVLVKAQLAT